MKKIVLTALVVVTSLTACKENKKEKVDAKEAVKIVKKAVVTNNVDVVNSTVLWKGYKPTGSHNGSIMVQEGSLQVADNNVTGGSFVVAMKTIKVLDMPEGSDSNSDLTNHLIQPDFFDIVKFPTSKFLITSSVKNDGKLAITGNLTIKGITKSITIPATLSEENGMVVLTSDTFKVDRTVFGIEYKSKKFFENLKDKFIEDLIDFSFVIKAKK